MAHAEKIKSDAKHVEEELNLMGEHLHAQRVARLRKGYASAIATMKTLHRDNMELRNRLGLPNSTPHNSEADQ